MTQHQKGYVSPQENFSTDKFRDRDYKLVFALAVSGVLEKKVTEVVYPSFPFEEACNRALKLGDEIRGIVRETSPGSIIMSNEFDHLFNFGKEKLDEAKKENVRMNVIRLYEAHGMGVDKLVSETIVYVNPKGLEKFEDIAHFSWGFQGDNVNDPKFIKTLELLCNTLVLRKCLQQIHHGANGFALLREGGNIDKTLYDEKAWEFINDRLSEPIELPKIYR